MEVAILNAMAEIWPMAEERLCHFHLQKALWTNIQKKKLLDLYEDPDVRSLLRCFGALALLPTNEVVQGYNQGWHAHINSLFPRGDMPLTQFIVRLQKEEEKIRNLSVRHEVKPGEGVRGRPSDISVREKNLRAFVTHYAQTAPENRAQIRVAYLRNVQLHLSPTAFARLLREREKENTAPDSSQSSQTSSQVDLPAATQASQDDVDAQSCCSRTLPFSGPFSAFSFDE
ncbi:hypothetical protein AAVH_17989, partial [Aphelenchoides avenae]